MEITVSELKRYCTLIYKCKIANNWHNCRTRIYLYVKTILFVFYLICRWVWLLPAICNKRLLLVYFISHECIACLYINRSIMFSLPLFGRRTLSYNVIFIDFCFRGVTVRIGVEWYWRGSGVPFWWVGLCATECWCRKKTCFIWCLFFGTQPWRRQLRKEMSA